MIIYLIRFAKTVQKWSAKNLSTTFSVLPIQKWTIQTKISLT